MLGSAGDTFKDPWEPPDATLRTTIAHGQGNLTNTVILIDLHPITVLYMQDIAGMEKIQ